MSDLAKLIKDHAFWSDEFKRLKLEGEVEASQCTSDRTDGGNLTVSCIQYAYEEFSFQPADEEGRFQHDYVKVFNSIEPCQHCRNVRQLKKERVLARRKLGQIRGVMTRIGRTL